MVAGEQAGGAHGRRVEGKGAPVSLGSYVPRGREKSFLHQRPLLVDSLPPSGSAAPGVGNRIVYPRESSQRPPTV